MVFACIPEAKSVAIMGIQIANLGEVIGTKASPTVKNVSLYADMLKPQGELMMSNDVQ